MDTLNEKKWFVYMGDHHEGPFSQNEIQGQLASGAVTMGHFAWCDGMADWKMMSEIPDLQSLGGGISLESPSSGMDSHPSLAAEPIIDGVPTEAIPVEATAFDMVSPANESYGKASEIPVADDEKTGDLDPAAIKKINEEATRVALKMDGGNKADLSRKEKKLLAKEEKKKKKKQKEKKKDQEVLGLGKGKPFVKGGERTAPKLIRLLLFLLVGAGGFYLYSNGYMDPLLNDPRIKEWTLGGQNWINGNVRPLIGKAIHRFPALGDWISPLPSLSDVSAEDYDRLKSASLSSLVESGPKVEVAPSSLDPLVPTLYVASNLPEGIQFDVFVMGVPETLLNAFSMNIKVTAKQQFGLAKTQPIRQMDGRPVPRGMYRVFVMETPGAQPVDVVEALKKLPEVKEALPRELPQGRKVLGKGQFFFGGAQDAAYRERLKAYHDKMQVTARNEIGQLNQFYQTLESQFEATLKKFRALKNGRVSRSKLNQWKKFSTEWVKFDDKLQAVFSGWTPEAIQKNVFYQTLFSRVKEIGIKVSQLHQMHESYFAKDMGGANFDLRWQELTREVSQSFGSLKEKIQQAEQLPLTPNGMPRRPE